MDRSLEEGEADPPAEAPGEPEDAVEGEALIKADREAVTGGCAGRVGEAVADAPPHPAANVETATASRRNLRNVAFERRLI